MAYIPPHRRNLHSNTNFDDDALLRRKVENQSSYRNNQGKKTYKKSRKGKKKKSTSTGMNALGERYFDNFPTMNPKDEENVIDYIQEYTDGLQTMNYKEFTMTKSQKKQADKYINYKNLKLLYDSSVKNGYIVLNKDPTKNRANIDVEAYEREDEFQALQEWYALRQAYVRQFDEKVESGEIDLSWLRPDEMEFDFEEDNENSNENGMYSDYDSYSE